MYAFDYIVNRKMEDRPVKPYTFLKHWPYHAKKIAKDVVEGNLRLRNFKKISKCWNIFAKIENLDGELIKEFVFCRMCKRAFRFRNHSSANLLRHTCYVKKYVRKPETAVSIVKVETPKLQEAVTFDPSSSPLLKLMTKWIIDKFTPYDIVENAGFVEVFQQLIVLGAEFGTNVDVETVLPNLTTISRNVDEMYEHCFQKVKAEITEIKDIGFGLTMDIWTDSRTKQSCIALTIHHLNNGSLTFSLLRLRLIYGESLSSHNIYEAVQTILMDFGCELTNKSIVVTNGDGNAIEAFRDNHIPHFQCVNLLLQNALEKSVKAVPEVAELANACTKLINFLKKTSADANFSSSLQSCTPRRYSTIYTMLSCIENNWSDISQTLESRNESQRIQTININHLKAVTKTLQIFKEAIEALEEGSDATLHLVWVCLHELKKSCVTNDSECNDFDFIKRLKENLHLYLDKILTENVTVLHKLALFLYPPTNKLLLFSDKEKKFIEEECKKQCLENATKQWIQQDAEATSTSLAKRNKLFADFVEPEEKHGPNELVSEELQRYKNILVENSEDFDCFNWWELHKNIFPLLHKLSCFILAVPASIAAAQKVFTVGGSLTSKMMEFNSNHSETEKVLFLKFNQKEDCCLDKQM